MKRNAAYFLMEFVIVTLGVSLSLFMNDYREKRKNSQLEVQLLKVIESNLEMDSLLTRGHQNALELFSKSTSRMIHMSQEVPLDSFNIYLDHISSYSKLQTVDVGFTELTSSGLELENDTLYRALLSYYTWNDSYVEEWNNITSDFIISRMIPYVIDHFPPMVVKEGQTAGFAVEQLPRQEVLTNPGFNNLLVTNLMYQKNMRAISEMREQRLQQLLRQVRTELKKLQE